MELLSDRDQVVAKEPILEPVKHRFHAALFSSLDTNGNIHEFSSQLKKYLIEKYNVQFLFNFEVDRFIIETSDQEKQTKRIVGLQTKTNEIIENVDYFIVANGNFVMPLMKKLNIFTPVYPVKVTFVVFV